MWVRPLRSWIQELLTSRTLVEEFRWDAEKFYKWDGEKWVRFIDEPWTADGWWAFQVCLYTDPLFFKLIHVFQCKSTIPGSSKPFFIILYADKTRLSSFGTEKGYPVLVRCANLPANIRNSTGVGGGRLVGWLPIVSVTRTSISLII